MWKNGWIRHNQEKSNEGQKSISKMWRAKSVGGYRRTRMPRGMATEVGRGYKQAFVVRGDDTEVVSDGNQTKPKIYLKK